MEFLIRFEPSKRSVRVRAGTSLLEAARSAGLPVASSCGADGACGRCGIEILQGLASVAPESERESTIKQRNRVDAHVRLACLIAISGDLTVTTSYW